MTADAVLIGSVLSVLGAVVVFGYFVFRGIQHINEDSERHNK
ncbi:hypothetical protein [Motiliproteus sp. MSK22-1]|nr:hypothetical protein [Motiliproteus sp. MSK22-1]